MKCYKTTRNNFASGKVMTSRGISGKMNGKLLRPKQQNYKRNVPKRQEKVVNGQKESRGPPLDSFTYTNGIDEFEEDEFNEAEYEKVNSGRSTKVSIPSIRPPTRNNFNDNKAKMSLLVPEENQSNYLITESSNNFESMSEIPDESIDGETEYKLEKPESEEFDKNTDIYAHTSHAKGPQEQNQKLAKFDKLESRRKESYGKRTAKPSPNRKNKILQRLLSRESIKPQERPKHRSFRAKTNKSVNYKSNDDIRKLGVIDETKHKDFSLAYKAISKQLIENSINHDASAPSLLLTNREIKNYKQRLMAKAAAKKNDQSKTVYERLYNTNIRKVSKYVEDQAKEIEEREKMQTYFKPKTNRSKFGTRRRSHNDFINDINTFKRRKDFQIQHKAMRQEMEESKIVNSFFQGKKDRSKSPDYDKINHLYKQGVQKQLQRSISPKSSKLSRSIVPRINKRSQLIVRDQNVSDILYTDAQSRQDCLLQRRRSSMRKENNSPPVSNERNTTNHLISKISRELQGICLEEDFGTRDNNLKFFQVVVILIRMGYISEGLTETEKNLVNKLWIILRGEELNGISARNFLFFLLGIHKLKGSQLYYQKGKKENAPTSSAPTNISNEDIDVEIVSVQENRAANKKSILNKYGSQDQISKIGIFDKENKFFFKNQQDQAVASNLFDGFLKKKASMATCAYFIGANQGPVDKRYSYKPELISRQKKSGIKERPGTERRMYNSLLHSQSLLQKGKEYKKNKEEKKRQIIQEELKKCTFKPLTNSLNNIKSTIRYSSPLDRQNSNPSSKTTITTNICKRNFEKYIQEKFPTATDEEAGSPGSQAESQEKEAGISLPSWEDFEPERLEGGKTESPVLFLDVNFGSDKLTRIIMYKDDSPGELAEAFCREHNLNESKKAKLESIIIQHLNSALDRIEEEPEEC
ncbi:unnamed protein product [Moneuplotes crassus]|uniref:Uncharacterized protein n=1 Tax=Euplotes crassus TaxID=5936 RepID=A0AAD2D3I7_EUPCR|nr:unnamed protein product [Moneuplotes crassus]